MKAQHTHLKTLLEQNNSHVLSTCLKYMPKSQRRERTGKRCCTMVLTNPQAVTIRKVVLLQC